MIHYRDTDAIGYETSVDFPRIVAETIHYGARSQTVYYVQYFYNRYFHEDEFLNGEDAIFFYESLLNEIKLGV